MFARRRPSVKGYRSGPTSSARSSTSLPTHWLPNTETIQFVGCASGHDKNFGIDQKEFGRRDIEDGECGEKRGSDRRKVNLTTDHA
jgi:hypothetical protein